MGARHAGYPILIISGQQCQATISGNGTWLSENSSDANFNPSGTPYQGQSNSDTADDYPPQYHGIIHIIGGSQSSVQLNANAYLVGTLIADCPVRTSNQCTLIQDPTIYAENLPLGLCDRQRHDRNSRTWRWDILP